MSHDTSGSVWVCEPVDTASLSLMVIPDWTLFLQRMEPRSEFKLWKFEEKLLMRLKIQHLRLKFLCLVFSEPTGPRRIPLRGPPMILFSVVCICWFDNPVILPSEGDSGSANTQQHGKLLDCDGAHCSSQTMSSL